MVYMNLRRLEYFITMAQVGNLTKASELLHVSPPALSKAMKLLEEEVEAELWAREGRKLTLTDAGKALLRKVPHLMEELKKLKESLQKKDPQQSPLRIGTFEVFSTYFLSFLDRIPWETRPLELHELLPGEVEKYCAACEIDIGITYIPIPHPELDFLKVASLEMGVFVLKSAFKGIAQQELPFVIPVMPIQGVPTKVRGLDGWPEDAYQRKVLHRVTLMESALELCRQGKTAGYFPVFVAEEHNRQVRPEFQLERRRTPYSGRSCYADVYIVKRKSSTEDRTVKQLAKVLRGIS